MNDLDKALNEFCGISETRWRTWTVCLVPFVILAVWALIV